MSVVKLSILVLCCLSFGIIQIEGSYPERVLLRDVSVITLHNGQYTNARRSSPIPQLKCVGGTAGCSAFTPKVVQCYNRGSDGHDAQWECKTDMDQAYRFGELVVSCEGFDHPNDPYIVRGSCGLEYNLDLTGVGNPQHERQYGSRHQSNDNYRKSDIGPSIGTYVMLVIVFLVLFKACQWYRSQEQQNRGQHSGSFASAPPPPEYSASPPPPPPGFRPEYMPGNGFTEGGCSNSSSYPDQTAHSATGTGGGFWTGAATGGILGYLFGSRNAGTYHQPYYSGAAYSYSWGNSSDDYGSSGSWFQQPSTSSASSGTRTASGFGGTTHR